jgi:hypothetical protein
MSLSPIVPRKVPRATISALVQLRRSGELRYEVHVFDLSQFGCKVEFVERPRIGETVWVKFNGLEALEATVRWLESFHAGLEFIRPINECVLEMLLNRFQLED